MELKNRSFQYGKYLSRTIVCMPHLEAGRGSRASAAYSVHFLKIFHGLGRRVDTWNYRTDVLLAWCKNCYRDVLLSQHLLPAICSVAEDFFTFQQDNAPAHRAGDTVKFLSRNTPDFISLLLWPPNRPDRNPVDWGVGCAPATRLP